MARANLLRSSSSRSALTPPCNPPPTLPQLTSETDVSKLDLALKVWGNACRLGSCVCMCQRRGCRLRAVVVFLVRGEGRLALHTWWDPSSPAPSSPSLCTLLSPPTPLHHHHIYNHLQAELPNKNLHKFKGQAQIYSEAFRNMPISPGSFQKVWEEDPNKPGAGRLVGG